MKRRALKSSATPIRRSTSGLNIHGRVNVDLRKTVEILRNSGVNVTVCNQESPPINPTIVGKGKATQSKGKQSMTPTVLAKGNGKALTIDFPTNKRQKTRGNGNEKKENENSNEVINISRYAIGQQRRRERERLEGRIRAVQLRGLVPTKKAIAQRHRNETKRNGIDLRASSKQTNVDLLSGLEAPDLVKQPIKNVIPQRHQREIKRNEIDLHVQRRQTEIKRIEIDLHASSKEMNVDLASSSTTDSETNVDLVSLSTADSETLNITKQPNIREITPLTTHGKKNNLQGQTRRSMLGRIPSPCNKAGELPNVELTENETAQVHSATTPNICLMQEEKMELTKNETVLLHPATPPSVCFLQENRLISPPDLSTAISLHRRTYLQLFLILYLGRVTL